jgi:hypothetical protein
MLLEVLAGSTVFSMPSGSNNRFCIAVASGLPSTFSAMRPSSA